MRIFNLNYIVVTVMLLSGCKPKAEESNIATSATVVDVTQVRSLQPSLPIVLPGELKAWNRTLILARVKGYVGQLNVDRGTQVRKGQVLAVLEAPEAVAELNQIKARVSSAAATVIEQRTKQHASRLTYKRIEETSRTEGAVSANELDIAYARMMADSALADASAQNLQAARAQLISQQQLVDYLQVRAPFDGTITERHVSPGDLVGADGNRPLFVLEDRSRLRLTVAIPENLANAIEPNSTVTFTVQADPSRTYHAKLARTANTLEERNRTMITEFDFVNADDNLKAGMYAEVRLPVMRNVPTLFAPRTALIHSTEGVFLVRIKDEMAEWVAVRKGNSLDSLVEVFGAINNGDRIVRYANEELRDGQPISMR